MPKPRPNRLSTVKRLLHCLALLLICTHAAADLTGRVVKVADGDTIELLGDNKEPYRVRLIGIDAPEYRQPYGNAARKHLASLIAGKRVLIESTKTDRYGRILGKIRLNNIDINLEQVKSGYAWWYRYHREEQSETEWAAYAGAEQSARDNRRGLWNDPKPIAPYLWRKQIKHQEQSTRVKK